AREIADAQAADRLFADIAEQMACGKIIAIEFLVIRTILFGDEGRAANRNDAHEFLDRTHNRDRDVVVVLHVEAVVIDRARFLDRSAARIHVEFRRGSAAEPRAAVEAEAFGKAQALDSDGPREDRRIAIERRPGLLECQGYAGGNQAGRVD